MTRDNIETSRMTHVASNNDTMMVPSNNDTMMVPVCDICGAQLLSPHQSLSSLSCGHVYHSTCLKLHVSQRYDCKVCHCPASVSSIFQVKISCQTTGKIFSRHFGPGRGYSLFSCQYIYLHDKCQSCVMSRSVISRS